MVFKYGKRKRKNSQQNTLNEYVAGQTVMNGSSKPNGTTILNALNSNRMKFKTRLHKLEVRFDFAIVEIFLIKTAKSRRVIILEIRLGDCELPDDYQTQTLVKYETVT